MIVCLSLHRTAIPVTELNRLESVCESRGGEFKNTLPRAGTRCPLLPILQALEVGELTAFDYASKAGGSGPLAHILMSEFKLTIHQEIHEKLQLLFSGRVRNSGVLEGPPHLTDPGLDRPLCFVST